MWDNKRNFHQHFRRDWPSLIGIWPDLSFGTITWFAYMMSLVFAVYFQYVYIFGHFRRQQHRISSMRLVSLLVSLLAPSFGFQSWFLFGQNAVRDSCLCKQQYPYFETLDSNFQIVLWYPVNEKKIETILTIVTNRYHIIASRSVASLLNMLISVNAITSVCYSMTGFRRRSTDFKEDLNISTSVACKDGISLRSSRFSSSSF